MFPRSVVRFWTIDWVRDEAEMEIFPLISSTAVITLMGLLEEDRVICSTLRESTVDVNAEVKSLCEPEDIAFNYLSVTASSGFVPSARFLIFIPYAFTKSDDSTKITFDKPLSSSLRTSSS